MYSIVYTKKAVGDINNLKSSKLDNKAKALIELIRNDPYKTPPSYEKLQGNLKGAYSRRINIKHRLVYEVYEEDKIIKIVSLWSHYDF
ncbi:Txe/YoeB family addiction module toxin [Lachnoanaerobaculum gingivalis]|jgi:addiction module toxin, txe/yoeB family|uniref:Txe/YoeB family addiction module toxin n=1 Tax=Lachnoanaerobaculum gingivalis TaxID=2490855 RepID=UPI0024A648C2|nr:Txe/YoeB family addiction module toxin [Lachnoanaerobaculum gingivalis]WHE88673.1 Txe/YoeB family addiction module toxin [Lachnoanaerobaculum gingivalis]